MNRLLLLISLGAWLAPGAWAQSFCASDGQASPLTLIERFMSADCEACWQKAQPKPSERALTLDWIVPSGRGDEAPLAVAASPEALLRLESLGRAAPAGALIARTTIRGGPAPKLRVAHGVPVGGYIGASIEFKANTRSLRLDGTSSWLLLVETVPAGTDGTRSERHLVRNVLISRVDETEWRSSAEPRIVRERRPLSIPPGASPQRLRVVGWLQDAQGRVLSAAQSACRPPP